MAIFETLDDEPMRGVWRKNWAENCPNTVQKGFRASHTFRLGSSGVSYYSPDYMCFPGSAAALVV
jgi:hypothetical protein